MVWGQIPGGAWLPLEPDATPAGDFTFLPWKERSCVLGVRGVPHFRELSPRTRALVRPDMREFWREVLDGPRYRPHDRECAREIAQSVGYIAAAFTEDLLARGITPHILEGDRPYFD